VSQSIEAGPVRHVLLARLRADTPAETFAAIIGGYRAMVAQINGLVGFEYGTNNSSENLQRGFTHVMTLTFASVAARDAYLPHPAHQQFAAWASQLGVIEEVLVIDYVPLP
jgi:hypothetical protein